MSYFFYSTLNSPGTHGFMLREGSPSPHTDVSDKTTASSWPQEQEMNPTDSPPPSYHAIDGQDNIKMMRKEEVSQLRE
jgi:hypothetical protein